MFRPNLTVPASRPSGGALTVDRGLQVLEAVSRADGPIGVRELARTVDLSVATAHRLLTSLQARGFVEQVGDRGEYRLGWGLLEYAARLIQRTELLPTTIPLAAHLRDVSEETVTVHIRLGDERVCVAEVESHHDLHRAVGVGRRSPLIAGASGRAILAFLPEPEVANLLSEPTGSNLAAIQKIGRERLMEAVAETRAAGYATSSEEWVPGVSSMAAPLMGPAGYAVGSVGIAGPVLRWTPTRMAVHRDELLATAERMSHALWVAGVATTGAQRSSELVGALLPPLRP